ncbi:MAG: molybdopterin-dependent oxidoreductase, partial [Synergistales bacterium]|nr:molybdopterin-dependent oxidoreductase [Synergistales bacterium]
AMIEEDMPILAEKEILYFGQPLALIAAPDRLVLEKALSAVLPIEDETVPLLDIEEALKANQLIYGKDNLMADYSVSKGSTEEGFKRSDLVITGRYRTSYHEHVYLETQGMIAYPTTTGVEITGSMQCPYYIHRAATIALPFNGEDIVIRQTTTGGGFGGKEDFPSLLALHASLLAIQAGKPVKMVYDREEDILYTTKRHPSVITHRTGLTEEGLLLASEIDIILDGGACTTLSPVVLQRAILHGSGPYNIPNIRIRGRVVATNTPPNGAFRGFGVPQSCFAVERHMDRIAGNLGMDPVELRRKNLLKNGDLFPFGQVMKEEENLRTVFEEAIKRSDYYRKKEEFTSHCKGSLRKGIGFSLFFHGGGFTGSGEEKISGKARVALAEDGLIDILVSSVEMGQGATVMFTSVAADALGLPVEMFRYSLPDTSRVPDSGPTVASRTTMYVGKLVMDASRKMMKKLMEFSAHLSGVDMEQLKLQDGWFFCNGKKLYSFSEIGRRYLKEAGPLSGEARYYPPPGSHWNDETFSGEAYRSYSWGADVTEVEVDMGTYEIRPLKLTSVVEVGKVINVTAAKGQVEGGTLQGLGYAYLEDLEVRDGIYTSGHLTHYHIPTSWDTPDFDVTLREIPYEEGPFGAKGLGELPMDGSAPSLVSAVENATGLSPKQIPIGPEVLYRLRSESTCGEGSEDAV